MKKLFCFMFAIVLLSGSLAWAAVDNFYIKTGDLLPYYRVVFRSYTGVFKLTDTTITMTMVDADGTTVVSAASVNITNATRGEAEYRWLSGDTDTAGTYRLEFAVTDVGGRTFTLPSSFQALVIIVNTY